VKEILSLIDFNIEEIKSTTAVSLLQQIITILI